MTCFVEMINRGRNFRGSGTERLSIEEKLIALCEIAPERRLPTRSSSSNEPNLL